MARTKALSPATEKKLRAWEQLTGASILNHPEIGAALAQLENDGCDPDTLVLVLELGRVYISRDTTALTAKKELEERHAHLVKLVDSLRTDAKAIDRLLQPGFIHAAALSKKMVAFADQLKGFTKYMKLAIRGGLFGRELGMTLWSAVFAAELIERKTNSPHYSELVEIFSTPQMDAESSAKMNVVSFSRKIKRFRKRNSEFIPDKTGRHKFDDVVRDWIEEWKGLESALKSESRVGGSKSNFRVRVPSSKFGVQVQGTPRASSSNPPTAAKKKPGHQT
jgi:hypothetical protein